jgi:pseudaminic acid biosynthesis-associated methylase
MSTVETWQGEFGTAYTDRNLVDPMARCHAFSHMLRGLALPRILEIGCNRGHNLAALRSLYAESDLVGLEPNAHARLLALQSGFPVINGSANDLIFRDNSFDLVFTAGVLIHIPAQDLAGVLREITRVASRYVLAIEYFSEQDTEIEYRGNRGLLWKRNFLSHYQKVSPGMQLAASGYWSKDEGFDRCHWWLMSKGAQR